VVARDRDFPANLF